MTRAAVAILSIALALTAAASTPSYWWSQMQVKPDAQQSQAFWFVPGQGVYFTYQTNHVIINAGPGGGSGITTNICVVFCDGSTNNLFFTNGLLVAVNAPIIHCPSLIQPGGGYVIQPNGGTLCLP